MLANKPINREYKVSRDNYNVGLRIRSRNNKTKLVFLRPYTTSLAQIIIFHMDQTILASHNSPFVLYMIHPRPLCKEHCFPAV